MMHFYHDKEYPLMKKMDHNLSMLHNGLLNHSRVLYLRFLSPEEQTNNRA